MATTFVFRKAKNYLKLQLTLERMNVGKLSEMRKIERSVRLMECIRRNDINEDNIFYTPLTGDGKVSI